MSSKQVLIGAASALFVLAAAHVNVARAATKAEIPVIGYGTSAVEVHRVVVSFADLNLHRAADVAMLYQRIDDAAGLACGWRYFTGTPGVSPFWVACRNKAINNTIHSLHQPQLTAYARTHAPEASRQG